jgi:hypothetical protein
MNPPTWVENIYISYWLKIRYFSVADLKIQDLSLVSFLPSLRDPGDPIRKNPDPGSWINIRDPQHWTKYIKTAMLPTPPIAGEMTGGMQNGG